MRASAVKGGVFTSDFSQTSGFVWLSNKDQIDVIFDISQVSNQGSAQHLCKKKSPLFRDGDLVIKSGLRPLTSADLEAEGFTSSSLLRVLWLL